MRLAFVVYGSLDNVSGGFIYDRALAAALAALGHEIDVIGLPWHGYVRAAAGSVLRSALREPPLREPPPRERDAGPRRYDAVLHDELVHPSVFHRVRRVAPADRTVALVHNLASEQPRASLRALKAALERRFLAGVDAAVAVCQRTLASVRALAGDALPGLVAHAGRDHIAPAVDEADVDQRSRAPGPLRILHLASVVPAKGLHRLLTALATVAARHPQRDFTLDVAGATPSPAYARAVLRQAARLGLASRVRLHGQLNGAALHALCRRSHVMALPSDREAYSLACLEALGFGLPVLATSAGGLGEMIAQDREGALLAPDDGDAWAAALGRLAVDRGVLAAMGRAALARYRGHATWRQVALSVQQFLQALPARPPSPHQPTAGR